MSKDSNASTSKTKSDSTKEEDKATKDLIEALEEDDDFEEFEPEHWSKGQTGEADETTPMWTDNWDDDVDDDFTKSLRAELEKNSK